MRTVHGRFTPEVSWGKQGIGISQLSEWAVLPAPDEVEAAGFLL